MSRVRGAFVVCLVALVASGAFAAFRPQKNLCYNGTFDAPGNPLDGWMTDYSWSGISHYMQNGSRVSALATYKGKRNVIFMNGTGETKVESPASPERFL